MIWEYNRIAELERQVRALQFWSRVQAAWIAELKRQVRRLAQKVATLTRNRDLWRNRALQWRDKALARRG